MTTVSVAERLQQAVGSGEIVSIRYDGGSQPGAHREILPLQVGTAKVRARCYTSAAVKEFMLSKITILAEPLRASGDGPAKWDAAATAAPAHLTVPEIADMHRSALEALGWRVLVERTDDGEYLNLYRLGKRTGKPLKHPTVTLGFEPMTWDSVAGSDGGFVRANVRPRRRPWGVRANGASCGTWSGTGQAVGVLLSEATAHA